MPTTAVEHDTDEKATARGVEARREETARQLAKRDSAPPIGRLATAPSDLLHARLLLGLQSMAGNAAVADLIETRTPAAISPPPLAREGREGDATAPAVTTEAPAAEEATVAAVRAGESDDELAALDAAAGAPPVEGQSAPERERELVAQSAQAELADQHSDAPEAQGGGAEPGTPIAERPRPVTPDVSTAEPASGLARIAGLPPAQLLSSLGTVSIAVEGKVNGEHE